MTNQNSAIKELELAVRRVRQETRAKLLMDARAAGSTEDALKLLALETHSATLTMSSDIAASTTHRVKAEEAASIAHHIAVFGDLPKD